jgi:ribosomal protein S18 acetylase RimI-like enzyme
MKMQVHYSNYTEEYKEELLQMVKSLYLEPGGQVMSDGKIMRTIDFLSKNPDQGKIVIFRLDGKSIGYSILINFWSNEFGGLILIIDELFIREEFRNRGVGTDFIQMLTGTANSGYKAIQLEVYPSNTKALHLYTLLGFEKTPNHFLRLVL